MKKRLPRKKKRFGWRKYAVGFCLLVVLMLAAVFGPPKRLWNGKEKLSLAVNTAGSISVINIDPANNGMTLLLLPGNTEVNVARQLGTWKIKSVWQLGFNESYAGRLLAETITKNIYVPAVGWADKEALGFWEGNPRSLAKAVFVPYPTNLTFSDKLRLAVFALRVKEFKKTTLDLAGSVFLQKKRLLDGEEGYQVSGFPLEKLLAVAADDNFAKGDVKVQIVDASGREGLAGEVGKIIESLGAKVALVRKIERDAAFDCRVAAKTPALSRVVSRIFTCETAGKPAGGNFDLEIKLGESFAKRF